MLWSRWNQSDALRPNARSRVFIHRDHGSALRPNAHLCTPVFLMFGGSLSPRFTPVVLVAHSMGCLIAKYFLNYAEQVKGRAWIDQHVYSLYSGA